MIIQVSSSLSSPVLVQAGVTTPFATSASYAHTASALIGFVESASFSTTSSYAERTAYAHFAQLAESASYASIAAQSSFAATASIAESASYAPYTPLPEGTVSASSQIEHDLTTGFSASRHVDHASVLMVAGDGLSGGGNIQASRTFRLNTGSAHFIDGVRGITVDSSSFATQSLYSLTVSNGLISGGILQVNTDNTKFNVLGGSGLIVDSSNNVLAPTVYQVSWPDFIGVSSPFLNTDTFTSVFIDRTGSLHFTNAQVTPQEERSFIYLGRLGHSNRTFIANTIVQPYLYDRPIDKVRDLYRAIGLINEGNIISPDGANLSFNRGAGTLTGLGIGYEISPSVPNIRSYSATTPVTFSHRTQVGSGSSNITILDVANYDLNGTITPVGGNNNRSQNFRVFLQPNGNVIVQYGQQTYANLGDAVAGIPQENFTRFVNVETAALLAVISVRRGATNLNNANDAVITQAGKFGSVSNVGAGLALIAQYSGSFTGSLSGSAIIAETASFLSGSAYVKSVQEHYHLTSSLGSGTSSFDYNSGSIFYLTGLSANGTWNIVNVPTDDRRVHTFTFIVSQSATPYSASAYQINNSGVTVRWQENNPTGSANRVNTIGLNAIRSGSNWVVLGSLSTFM